jgi:RNA polymerase sigma-70 factor (ECF subfamily)
MLRLVESPVTLPAAAEAEPQLEPDAKLLDMTRGMRAGVAEGWETFASLYLDRLLRYLLVLCHGDEDQSRDLLQETLLRVARHVRPCEREEALWSWLTRVARSAHCDATRKRGRYFAFLGRFRSEPREETQRVDPLPMLLERELKRLPAEDRELLERKYFEERPVREIAKESGVTEKAIESRLSRLRAKLRMCLLEELKRETGN